MTSSPARCLILACGNTLRGDDGVGPWLAAWAEERFRAEPAVRVLARQQWTPDLAEEVAPAGMVLFVDCAANIAPGLIQLLPVEPSAELPRLLTHHLGAADLLALGRDYYDSLPLKAMLLTVGAGSLELHEGFSDQVNAVLPDASKLLETTVLGWLSHPEVA
jgi:hydrogenase maturation protease